MKIARHAKTEPWLRANVSYDGDECLIWPFGKDSLGYGRATAIGFKTRLAHRIMCEMVNGPAPEGKPVCRHSCGNGHLGCVSPKHLVWGTVLENSLDMQEHGTKQLGEAVPRSVLTESGVRKIRALKTKGWSYRLIAEEFNVSPGTIQAVVEGRTWGHVQ